MAEIDFDDEELNAEDAELDAQESIQETALSDDLSPGTSDSGFFTRKRLMIIAAVTSVLVLLGGGIWFFSGNNTSSENATSTARVRTDTNSSTAPLPEKPKRKKRVKYDPLFKQLTSAQLSPIIRELSFNDIPFRTQQIGTNYNIDVDEDRVEESKALLAIKGLPDGGSRGFELLDDTQTLGVTEFDKRVRFLRALSGELEKAIIQFDAIESCKVQIVLPEQRLFAVTQPPVTASILIRKQAGYPVTDDIVFSVIQLISKAVENLQPENVSVIDTEGVVLSMGIFERMAARAEGLLQENDETNVEEDEKFKRGQPIIPNFKDMAKWLEVKRKYERELEDKAIQQLLGILPIGSFKLTVTSELGPLDDGDIIDVRRLTASIVVDNNNEDIFLDAELKQEIFTTVAGAIAYVRDRDNIQLSKADFLLFSDEELARLNNLQKGSIGTWIAWVAGAIIVMLGAGYLLRRRKHKKEEDADTPFLDSLGGSSPFVPSINNEQSIARIKDVARTTPQVLADIMGEWMGRQPEKNALSTDDTDDTFFDDAAASADEEEATINA